MGIHQLVLAIQIVTGSIDERHRQGGCSVETGACVDLTYGGFVVVIAKLGQFGVPGQIVPVALLVVVVVDARQHGVRLLSPRQQDLIGSNLSFEVPVLLEVTGRQGLLQLVVDLSTHAGIEVVEVVVVIVPHLGVVHRHPQGIVDEHGGVAGIDQIAMPVGQVVMQTGRLVVLFVVVQVLEIEAADMGRIRHVAELDLVHQAPSVHETGGDGSVVVGGYVPVEWLGDLHAIVGTLLVIGVKQAGLALILDREIDVRGVEDRIVIEPEGCVIGLPKHLGLIDIDAARLQGPGLLTRWAGGVLSPFQGDVLVVVGHGHLVGEAAHR
ncbi:hypothetical protein D3C79_511540 [compost metagenome]